MLPNFFIIGATRAGTTSLFQYLRQHPDIFLPKIKEIWGFNVDDRYERLAEYYDKVMKGHRGESRVGDITPIYLTKGLLYSKYRGQSHFSETDSTVRRIAKSCPNAKVIVTLRSPMDRLLSQFKKNHFQGKASVASSLEMHARKMLSGECERKTDFIYANNYADHLRQVYDVFPADQVKILFLEEWSKTPDLVAKEILEFLNLDVNVPIDTSKQYNGANNYKTKGKNLIKIFSNFKPKRAQGDQDPFKISEEVFAEMNARFKQDISYIENKIGRSIPAWHR